MVKSNRQINKENSTTDNSPDSPAVLAYRMTQVEIAVKEGFDSHNQKLDEIVDKFSTKAELQAIELRVTKVENRDNVKQTLLWVGLVASVIINIVALYNLFTGG